MEQTNICLADLGITPHTAASIVSMEVTDNPFVVEGVAPRSASGIISGEGESAKSLITEHLAIAVSNGISWFGRAVVQGPVLILDQENTFEFDLKPRFQALAAGYAEQGHTIMLDNIQIPRIEADFALDTPNGLQALDLMCTMYKPQLVVVDSMIDFVSHASDTNNVVHMTRFFQGINSVARKHSCSFLIIHHMNKGGQGYDLGDRLLGSVGIRNSIRSHVAVTKSASGLITLAQEKSNRSAKDPETLNLRIDSHDGALTLRSTAVTKRTRKNQVHEQNLRDILRGSDGLKRAEVISIAQERFAMDENTVDNTWDRMKKSGETDQTVHGIWRLASVELPMAS